MTFLHDVSAGAFAPRRMSVGLLMVSVLAVGATSARADCQADIAGLMSKRMAAVASVNKAKTKEGKLDPTLACPRLRVLSTIETQATAYLSTNKDWCNVPDDFLDKMQASAKRSAGFATQACTFAVKVKQMQQQQAQQQQAAAPKLPAGPL